MLFRGQLHVLRRFHKKQWAFCFGLACKFCTVALLKDLYVILYIGELPSASVL